MRGTDDFHSLGPVFEEDRQNVESLIDLAVCVDQVTVVHSKDIIDANVDIDACELVLVLEQRHFYGGNIAQGTFFGHRLDYLAAVFDKLMLVVGHATVEHNDDIDVAATGRP